MGRTLVVLCVLLMGCGAPDGSAAPLLPQRVAPAPTAEELAEFQEALEDLRLSHDIPSMSAALVAGGEIVWSAGLGQADPQRGIAATPSTAYHYASLTKPFAAVLLMQLVEEGLVDLDDPVSKYGIDLDSDGTIRVRHLLNHTSEGTPGDAYHYSGNRFGYIEPVFEVVTGKTFDELMVERLLAPLEFVNTAPNVDDSAFRLTGLDRDQFRANMAAPYESDEDGLRRSAYRDFFGPAAGMIGSVEDMALFSIAVDEHQFLSEASTALMMTPAVSNSGTTLPYAIGWFVTPYRGVELQWHYGWWDAASALIVRAPARDMAFVVMANTDAMSSRHRGLGAGDLLDSPFAELFLESFVTGR